jgi:hypothetical protein
MVEKILATAFAMYMTYYACGPVVGKPTCSPEKDATKSNFSVPQFSPVPAVHSDNCRSATMRTLA